MPVQYTPSKYAFYTSDEILVEQEHKEDCDSNVIIKRAHNGQFINTKNPAGYGYDDVTLDGVQYRILREQVTESINETLENEFEEEDAEKLKAALPENLAKRVKVKRKQDPDLSKSMESMVQSSKQIKEETQNVQRTSSQIINEPS